jgi:hypothetical protein
MNLQHNLNCCNSKQICFSAKNILITEHKMNFQQITNIVFSCYSCEDEVIPHVLFHCFIISHSCKKHPHSHTDVPYIMQSSSNKGAIKQFLYTTQCLFNSLLICITLHMFLIFKFIYILSSSVSENGSRYIWVRNRFLTFLH